MSNIHTNSIGNGTTTWPNWLREPLLHFMILGGLLFTVDHFIAGKTDDPLNIVITEENDDEAEGLFAGANGRKPNDEEKAALRRIWLDNEVLYREGLALQLDKGDTAIRERVIFKSLSVIEANVKLPPHDDKLLRDWFENHRIKYDEPERYDFQEAVLSGDSSEVTVRAFVATLNSGKQEETNAGLRVFKGRPYITLEQSYGSEFAKGLQKSVPGEWQAQPTRDGWRAIRLESITPAKPGIFENLRGVVLQDWTDATMSGQRSAAVHTMTQKYTVKIEEESK